MVADNHFLYSVLYIVSSAYILSGLFINAANFT